MSIDCRQDLFKALEMVVLVYRDDDRCNLWGDLPGWFRKLCPDVLPGSLPAAPEERFPFLIDFLVDARDFWDLCKGGESGRGYACRRRPMAMTWPLKPVQCCSTIKKSCSSSPVSTIIQKSRP